MSPEDYSTPEVSSHLLLAPLVSVSNEKSYRSWSTHSSKRALLSVCLKELLAVFLSVIGLPRGQLWTTNPMFTTELLFDFNKSNEVRNS